MSLLLDLYLGHLLGDFVLQPGWLVSAKRNRAWGLLLHIAMIGLSTALILGRATYDLWNLVLLAMAAHLLIEIITIRIRDTAPVAGLSVFLIDQGLHITSLVALVWVASRFEPLEGIGTLGLDVETPLLALACALISVTFMGAIIIHETLNAFGPASSRRVILPWDAARAYGVIERATALLLGVLVGEVAFAGVTVPGMALMLLPFLPRVAYALRRSPEEKAAQMLTAVVGLVITVVGWLSIALVTLASTNVG